MPVRFLLDAFGIYAELTQRLLGVVNAQLIHIFLLSARCPRGPHKKGAPSVRVAQDIDIPYIPPCEIVARSSSIVPDDLHYKLPSGGGGLRNEAIFLAI